ncbi:hypothetical protein SteCoe_2124 [Stentor coeruleus]|uniref:B box-type domain-containing protein n=1 Tax=Stentor coeruleus TaxID=5963 RepID=A0A1R2D053_9CILI|nr:hypothetical protein SteCoe_2124 [Stentor coeruleus]
MSKSCYVEHCNKEVSSFCTTCEINKYMCTDHVGQHIIQAKSHQIEALFLSLSPIKLECFRSKMSLYISYISKVKSNLCNATETLHNLIESQHAKVLVKLEDLESKINSIINSSESGKICETELFDMISNVKIPEEAVIFKNIKGLNEEINIFYNQELFKNLSSENSIFLFSDSRRLVGIDLITLKSKVISEKKKIAAWPQCCKINDRTFFFNGGWGSEAVGCTDIFYIDENRFEPKPESYLRWGGACVNHKDKIYIFGGSPACSGQSDLSNYLDLETNQWNDICKLPKASYANTATVLDGQILITGMLLSGVYVYENDAYTQIVNINDEANKIIFERWVITGKSFYEKRSDESKEWVEIPTAYGWKGNYLYTSLIVRRDNYVYMMDNSNELQRFDIEKKKIKKIPLLPVS